ncbi:MAG: hypothetical protein LBI18_07965 [Planctomycetaceae bacterium]|jgi:hypothetical protein|nr:hypothetical protein [Planctomycetaceae bacterium]
MIRKNDFNCFRCSHKQLRKRYGIYLPDICVGLVLISTAMVIFSQSLCQLIDHRTDQKLQQIAVDTLLNIQEMVDLETLSHNNQETLQPLEKIVAQALPDGKLTVEKLEEPTENNITFFRITVSYDKGKNYPRREFPLIRAIDSTIDSTMSSSTSTISDSQ